MKRLRNTRPAPILELPIHEPLKNRWGNHVFLNRKTVVAFLLLIVVGLGGYWMWQGQWIVTTGRVLMDQTHVTSPFRGIISDIYVQEGASVQRGQLLAKLDDSEFLAHIQQATAAMNQAQAQKQFIDHTGIDPQARMNLVRAERDHRLAIHRLQGLEAKAQAAQYRLQEKKREMERTKRLLLLKANTRFQWEQSVQSWQQAQAAYVGIQAALAERQVAVASAEQLVQEARQVVLYARDSFARDKKLVELDLEKAQAELRRAQARLAAVEIRAPQDGVVSWIPRKVGEVIDPHDTMLVVMNPQSVWVEGYIDAGDVVDIEEHRDAWVKINGLTDEYVEAKVSLVYPMERTQGNDIRVGPSRARLAGSIEDLTHTVKIQFQSTVPRGLAPEMVAWVWIARS